eukprot:TRINITY_DN6447_c0_g1_i2.p1 TRINITY_DN6447_c0_g1~~TRINITY_DN6447_c0_g1_i2.p1  ORF type:complete len:1858 (+),score=430.62 TRINITY_DN6447_c0_g1_i2:82-5655(+)
MRGPPRALSMARALLVLAALAAASSTPPVHTPPAAHTPPSSGHAPPPAPVTTEIRGDGLTPSILPWLTEFAVSVDAVADVVQINLTGPADAWYAVGFGGGFPTYTAAEELGGRMGGVWAVVVSAPNATNDTHALRSAEASVESYILGRPARLEPNTKQQTSAEMQLLGSAIASGRRSVSLSRQLAGQGYSFEPQPLTVAYVAACGGCGGNGSRTLTFDNHGPDSRWNDNPGGRLTVVFLQPPEASPIEDHMLSTTLNCTAAANQSDCGDMGCAWMDNHGTTECVECHHANEALCVATEGCTWHNASGDTAAMCEAACETRIHIARSGHCIPEQWVISARQNDYSWFEINCPAQTSDKITEELDWLDHMLDNLDLIGVSVGNAHTGLDHHDATPYNILIIFGTFAVGAALRFLCLGTKIPYTVVVFLVGMGFGTLGKAEIVDPKYEALADMDPHLIFFIFLPVLIFESAFAMEIPIFKQVLWQCIIMAGPGLLVAATCTGLVAKNVFTEYNWTLEAALLFGTIMSATDPVAVVALLKELGASKLISTMIEGESLFNDGTAIVFFGVLKASVERGEDAGCESAWNTCANQCYCEFECKVPLQVWEIVVEFFKVSLGGPLVGLIFGVITVQSIQRVFNDSLIEITLTVCSAYVTFFICEGMLHVSGVLGLVALGCYMSYFQQAISPDVEHTLHDFWEITVYLTNTCIFALAGMIVAMKAFDGASGMDALYLLITYITINIVRTFVLLLFTPILRLFKYKLTIGENALVAWGGLRGAVGLALALVIQGDDRVVVPNVRDKFIFQTAGIVILTLLVNGTTTQKLVKHFKLDAISDRRKKMMSEHFELLTEMIHGEIQDLGWNDQTATAYYDCNWEIVYRSTDLVTTIPVTHQNPYMPKTERLPGEGDDAAVDQGERLREEGRAAYYRTVHASTHKDYAQGVLSAAAVRDLAHAAITSEETEPNPDNPLALMPAKWLGDRFGESAVPMGSMVQSVPFLWEPLELEATVHGYDVALGYVSVHKLILKRIRNLAHNKVAGRIETHCKKSITDAKTLLKEITEKKPDVSCSIKTKHAARSVLNRMRHQVARMKGLGMLDAQDAAALTAEVLKRMQRLMKHFPRSLSRPTAQVALEACSWFQAADDDAKAQLLHYAQAGVTDMAQRTWFTSATPEAQEQLRSTNGGTEFPAGWKLQPGRDNSSVAASPDKAYVSSAPLSPRRGKGAPRVQPLLGLYIVVTGVIQIRLGRRIFLEGSGYTIGLQSVLTLCTQSGIVTNSERFSDVVTESPCVMVFIPREVIVPLLDKHPLLATAMWKRAGQQAARILLPLRPEFEHWDEHRIRHIADSGSCELLQDSDNYDWDTETKSKLRAGDAYYILLRGRCWEYSGQEPVRFPEFIPTAFKFATFTNHAVWFEMDAEDNACTRARKRWGRLRSKTRAIGIWSGLREPSNFWARVALARAFNRSPPADVLVEGNEALLESLRRGPPLGASAFDDTADNDSKMAHSRATLRRSMMHNRDGDPSATFRRSMYPRDGDPGATLSRSRHVSAYSPMNSPSRKSDTQEFVPGGVELSGGSTNGGLEWSMQRPEVLQAAGVPRTHAELVEEQRLRRMQQETQMLRRQVAQLAEQQALRSAVAMSSPQPHGFGSPPAAPSPALRPPSGSVADDLSARRSQPVLTAHVMKEIEGVERVPSVASPPSAFRTTGRRISAVRPATASVLSDGSAEGGGETSSSHEQSAAPNGGGWMASVARAVRMDSRIGSERANGGTRDTDAAPPFMTAQRPPVQVTRLSAHPLPSAGVAPRAPTCGDQMRPLSDSSSRRSLRRLGATPRDPSLPLPTDLPSAGRGHGSNPLDGFAASPVTPPRLR